MNSRPHTVSLPIPFRQLTLLAAALACASPAFAQATGSPVQELKKLSLEELMNLEVTSVSREPEKLSSAPSAIQVITNEEIRRSGATTLPEALRLATNLQVAQVNASQWAISARGFDNVLANKLLVMIDGRTVYTPLYAGVFWDVQDTLLEDVDRIEVVSGPGGTLWGSNAVNGVINVTTKSARDTTGLFLAAGAGDVLNGRVAGRYGARVAPDLYVRVYGKYTDHGATLLASGADAGDDWDSAQGGFRLDWTPVGSDQATFQGDFYDGRSSPDPTSPVSVQGGNLLGRWTHAFSADSDLQLQLYYDRTARDFGGGLTEDLNTYDFDGQHRFSPTPTQQVVWGLGVRVMSDTVNNTPSIGFMPPHRELDLYSAFAQDEFSLLADRVRLTLGTKLEHNDYTGFEFQPSARLAWMPDDHQTIWAAVSRAVRTPSRVDRDLFLQINPTLVLLQGNSDFTSEDLLAFELGWRVQPLPELSLSAASFYNDYDHLRSAAPGPPPFGYPITIENDVRGNAYGVELSGAWQPASWWRLRGGYTFLQKDLSVVAGRIDLNNATSESNDPEHQFQIQSSMDFSHGIEFDAIFRYVGALPQPYVASYVGLDVRLAWKPTENLEFDFVGRNLLDPSHPEFVPSSPSPREIPRSVYGQAVLRW